MAQEYDGRRPRLPVELARRIDAKRGQVPFNRFVVETLEKALVGGEADGSPAAVRPDGGRSVGPASSRASYVKPFNPRPKGS